MTVLLAVHASAASLQKTNPPLTTNQFVDVEYFEGNYVLLAAATEYPNSAPSVFISTDTKNWQAVTVQPPEADTPEGQAWGLIYYNGNFMIFDSAANVWTSPGGGSWTYQRTSMAIDPTTIQIGNGVLCANMEPLEFSYTWNVTFSTDGLTWTMRQPPNPVFNVVYNGGRFVGAWIPEGYNDAVLGTYFTTNAGMTWQAGSNVTNTQWYEDNTSCQLISGPSGTIAANVFDLNYDGDSDLHAFFVATSDSTSAWTQTRQVFSMTETNDNFWYEGSVLFWQPTAQCYCTYPFVISNDFGRTWTNFTALDNINFQNIAFTNGNFFALGTMGSVATAYSVDSWQPQADGLQGQVSGLAVFNDMFLLSFYGAGLYTYSSPDGNQWTKTNAASFFQWAVAGGVFYGFNSGTTLTASSDGVTWTSIPLNVRGYPSQFGYGNGVFWCLSEIDHNVHYNDVTEYIVSTTTDVTKGVWTQQIANNQTDTQVAFNNGVFLVVLNSQIYLAPGPTLRPLALVATNSYYMEVMSAGSLFFAQTSDFFLETSPDGKTWTRCSIPIGTSSWDVSFSQGTYYAAGATDDETSGSGNHGVVYSSPDGDSWSLFGTTYEALGLVGATASYVATTDGFANIYAASLQ